jgi:nitric oxide reductase NorE protein
MSFMQDRLRNPDMFETSRQTLNINLGGVDTLILLTSSWSVVLAIQALKRDLLDRVPRYLLGGALTGVMFVISKSIEYFEKFSRGVTPGTDAFYMWYFTLTGIHLIHVLVGSGLLTFLWAWSRRGVYNSSNRVVPEYVVSFWHLVDLLWIVLFPLLNLMKAA